MDTAGNPAADERPLDRQQAHLLGEQRAGHAASAHRLRLLWRTLCLTRCTSVAVVAREEARFSIRERFARSVPRQNRIEPFGAVPTQANQCVALVASLEAGIADNVGSEDRRQFALLTGHGTYPISIADRRSAHASRHGEEQAPLSLGGGRSNQQLLDEILARRL